MTEEAGSNRDGVTDSIWPPLVVYTRVGGSKINSYAYTRPPIVGNTVGMRRKD